MPLLELIGVRKAFRHRGSAPLVAVDGVSLSIAAGTCLALVGESGSGKSTLGRIALRLLPPDAGQVLLDGNDLYGLAGPALHRARMMVQPVFQDASASFNPRRTVRGLLRQALAQAGAAGAADTAGAAGAADTAGAAGAADTAGAAGAADTTDPALCRLLERVELHPAAALLGRYPGALSGGQRQRLSIARALATRPRLIIADEPLSGADVSIRAQILDVLAGLQAGGVGLLLITHDMLLARAVSDTIAVMHRGRIVESGPTAQVLEAPQQDYTRRLLAAVQSVDIGAGEGGRFGDG